MHTSRKPSARPFWDGGPQSALSRCTYSPPCMHWGKRQVGGTQTTHTRPHFMPSRNGISLQFSDEGAVWCLMTHVGPTLSTFVFETSRDVVEILREWSVNTHPLQKNERKKNQFKKKIINQKNGVTCLYLPLSSPGLLV